MTSTRDQPLLIDASEAAIGRVPDRRRDFTSATEVVQASPRDRGVLQRIVLRPERELRALVDEAVLDITEGVVGDNWLARGSRSMPDGRANLESQLTIMSTRVLAAIEPDPARWPLCGDQLLVDFDLSIAALPAGAHIVIGETELVISETPHTGCAKFSGRFGSDALRWVNSSEGRELRLRGVNARVVRGGTVRVGDEIRLA